MNFAQEMGWSRYLGVDYGQFGTFPMRSLRFLVAVISLALGGISVRADGGAYPAHATALPPAQPSVVVSLERGVRVWRPITDSEGYYGSQPVSQGVVEAPRFTEAPVGFGGYSGYGVYGGYGDFGLAQGYGARGKHYEGYGSLRGRQLPNRHPVFGGGHRTHVVINSRVSAPHFGRGHGHGGGYAPAHKVGHHGGFIGRRGGYGHGRRH
jgi:hypothetical protein